MILKTLPQMMGRLYADMGAKTVLYIHLRWMLSNFDVIEAYMPQDARILDAGCGYGLLANLMSLKSPERYVEGIDSSYGRISIASKSIRDRKNIKFIEKDIFDLDFKLYEAITISDVLHHIPHDLQDKLLMRMYSQMKQGGIVAIKEIDTRPVLKYVFSYLVDMILNLGQPLFFRSKKQWIALFKNIGFNVDTVLLHKDAILSSILYICKV